MSADETLMRIGELKYEYRGKYHREPKYLIMSWDMEQKLKMEVSYMGFCAGLVEKFEGMKIAILNNPDKDVIDVI